MVTIRDIARLAGVSTTTVSHAVNGTRYVKPSTKKKILRIVRTRHYRPNASALGLRTKNAKSIGVIIADIREAFFAEVVDSIERCALRHGYSILLCDSDNHRETEERCIELLLRSSLDGVIIASVGTRRSLTSLISCGKPFVQIDRKVTPKADFVGIDNSAGGKALIQLLHAHGACRILCLSRPEYVSTMKERLEGVRSELRAQGLLDSAAFLAVNYREDARSAVKECLRKAKRRFDAVLCLNLTLCYEALSAISDLALSIPTEIKIVCVDDSDWLQLLDPPVAALRQPVEEMGEKAFLTLLSRVTGARSGPPEDILLPTTIADRESCANKEEAQDAASPVC